MRQTIEGLLVLVRGEQNVGALKQVLVVETVSDTKERFRKQLLEKKIEWIESVPKDLKAYIAPEDLQQLFSIFIDNAIKYTPKGGLVTISGHSSGALTILEVKDNGAGIEEKDLPYVFERFYRGGSEVAGTGLGLAIAKKIIENYHGKITVKSTLGSGAIFTIQLPESS